MPIKYRINIIDALRRAGYSTYTIQRQKLIGNATMQKIRSGEIVNAANLDKLCKLLNCQPGDILEYVPDDNPPK